MGEKKEKEKKKKNIAAPQGARPKAVSPPRAKDPCQAAQPEKP